MGFIAWFSSRSCRNLICWTVSEKTLKKREGASLDRAEDIIYLSHVGCPSTHFYRSSSPFVPLKSSRFGAWPAGSHPFLVYSDPDSSIKKTKEKRATQHLPLLQLLALLFKQISQKQHQVCFTGGCASVLIKSSVPVFLSTSWRAALFWFFYQMSPSRQGQMKTDGGLYAVSDEDNGWFFCQTANITLREFWFP